MGLVDPLGYYKRQRAMIVKSPWSIVTNLHLENVILILLVGFDLNSLKLYNWLKLNIGFLLLRHLRKKMEGNRGEYEDTRRLSSEWTSKVSRWRSRRSRSRQ